MQNALKVFGVAALGLTILPPILFVAGSTALPTVKVLMLVGCILWFASAPFFLKGGAE